MRSLPRLPFLAPLLALGVAACEPLSTLPPPSSVIVVVVPGAPAVSSARPLQVAAAEEPPLAPVHLWHFDEPSGAAAVDVAGGEVGRLAPEVERVRGCAGGGVALGGNARSRVDLGTEAGQFGTRDFTVSLWFRTTTQHSNNELLSNRDNGSHGNFFNLRFARGKVVYELDQDTSGTNYVALESAPGMNDGAWHHVVARRRGASATLFVDGRRAADGSTGGVTNVDNGRDLEVGSSAVAGEYDLYFHGAVDEVAIFDRALSDDEASWLATGPAGCRPRAR